MKTGEIATRGTLASLIAVMTLLAFARGAIAEEVRPVEEARERFSRAVELFNGSMYEASLAEFQRAYELQPNYLVLYNIGQVQAQLGRFPEAMAAFERYLREGRDRLMTERLAEVTRELERLRRLVGRISLTTVRPEGAVITVDGLEVGRAPMPSPILVNSGNHLIEVAAEGHLPFRDAVTVAGGSVVTLEVELLRPPEVPDAPGTILLETASLGARVAVDGEEVGTTPLSAGIALGPGSHTLEVTREGYRTERHIVMVESGEVSRLTVTLEQEGELAPHQGGRIEVTASEPHVEIRLDHGPMPQEGVLPPGEYLVEVICPGFRPWSERVEVRAGSTTDVDAQLRPTDTYLATYRTRARAYRAVAWTTLGLTLAAGAVAAGLYGWNRGREGDWLDERAQWDEVYRTPSEERDPFYSDQEIIARMETINSDIDGIKSWNYAYFGLASLGVITAAISVMMFVIGPRPRRYRDLSISLDQRSLTLGWSWGGAD